MTVAEAGALERPFAARIRASAKLRNLLIHDYADIDYELLSNSPHQLIDDYHSFRRQIATWLKRSTDPQTAVGCRLRVAVPPSSGWLVH